jgi:hypothetical protein
MELPGERAARNDAVFREANEGIRAAAEQHGMEDRIPFICECADTRCTTIVQLSLPKYEEVRADPRRFVTAPGHESGPEDRTRVVESGDGYDVVEKLGIAGETAEALDPRSE